MAGGSGRVTKTFTGGRWTSPGSLPGDLRRPGRKGTSGSLPPALLPASLLLLVADCEEQEGRMYQAQRRRDPCLSPHDADSELQQSRCRGSGALRISSRGGQEANRIPKSGLFSSARRAARGHRSHIRRKGDRVCSGARRGLGWGWGAGPGPRRCQTPAECLDLVSAALLRANENTAGTALLPSALGRAKPRG